MPSDKNKKKKKTHLKNLDIHEVSFCAKGMNPGAKISLFKKDSSEEVEKMREFDEIINSDFEVKRTAMRSFERSLNLLEEAVSSAAFDFESTPEDRRSSIQRSIEQFSIHVSSMTEPLSKKKGESGMTKKELQKKLEALKLSKEAVELVEALSDESETATKAQEDALAKVDEITKEIEALKAEIAKSKETSDITDPIAKAKAEGASETVIKMLEDSIQKQKEQDEKQKKSDAEIAKMQEASLRKSCLETASKFSKIGKADELADMFLAIHKGENVTEKLEELFGRLEKALGESDLFKESGSAQEGDANSEDLVKMQKAVDVVKKDGMTKEQIISEVYEKHPELYEKNINVNLLTV